MESIDYIYIIKQPNSYVMTRVQLFVSESSSRIARQLTGRWANLTPAQQVKRCRQSIALDLEGRCENETVEHRMTQFVLNQLRYDAPVQHASMFPVYGYTQSGVRTSNRALWA